MVHNIQNHWAPGLCPSSGILNNYNTQRFGNRMSFPSGEGRETPTVLGSSERRPVIVVGWGSASTTSSSSSSSSGSGSSFETFYINMT
jgi:hypothetical protein